MLKHSGWHDSLLKYLTAAIILAVPLYPKFPFIRIPGTFVSIRLEDVLVAASSVFWLVIFYPQIKRLLKDKLVVSMVLFLIVGLISVASAVVVTHTAQLHIAYFHWLRRIEYFIPLFIGIYAIRQDNENTGFFFKTLLVVLSVAFVYGVGQKYLNWPIIVTQNEEYSKGIALRYIPGSHINSTFAGHYDLATFLVLVLPIIIVAFFTLKGMWTRAILGINYLFGLWLMVNSASRISLVSYLMSSVIALVLIKKYKVIPVLVVLSIVFTGFSSNLQARYGRLFEVTREKIENIISSQNHIKPVYASEQVRGFPEKKTRELLTPTPAPVFEDRSTSIRLNVEWPRAIRALEKNPMLGTGYSSITLATDNDYLRLLGEVGTLGFLAFFLVLGNLSLKLYKAFPLTENYQGIKLAFTAGYIGALPGLFVNAFFIDIFEASKFAIIFWLITGIVLSIVSTDYE
jgi:hypothetical protein